MATGRHLYQGRARVRLAVFGATGATGQELVRQAVDVGARVTALVREPSRLAGDRAGLEVVKGDVADAGSVDQAVAGQDAILSALGPTGRNPSTVCQDAARHITAAMERTGVRRLIAVSAFGAAESRNRSLYCRVLWRSVPHKMRDKEQMESLIAATALDWTIVRPPALRAGGLTGSYRVGPRLPVKLTSKVSRADLAHFMLRELEEPQWVGQTVTIIG